MSPVESPSCRDVPVQDGTNERDNGGEKSSSLNCEFGFEGCLRIWKVIGKLLSGVRVRSDFGVWSLLLKLLHFVAVRASLSLVLDLVLYRAESLSRIAENTSQSNCHLTI
ncbi:hypothetical protein PIB30_030970 [Stylosanthes scabra]|uniref:Uncharacterized protein n=1 Tax=Stylosanthes scabra TaxID=79078 RepID=A0ABU6TDJ2_9FABA|nr:hypothetical protein [Stylosanthes scabra]